MKTNWELYEVDPEYNVAILRDMNDWGHILFVYPDKTEHEYWF